MTVTWKYDSNTTFTQLWVLHYSNDTFRSTTQEVERSVGLVDYEHTFDDMLPGGLYYIEIQSKVEAELSNKMTTNATVSESCCRIYHPFCKFPFCLSLSVCLSYFHFHSITLSLSLFLSLSFSLFLFTHTPCTRACMHVCVHACVCVGRYVYMYVHTLDSKMNDHFINVKNVSQCYSH